MQLEKHRVLPIIKAALKEDIGKGDITTKSLVDEHLVCKAVMVAKEDCVICGLGIAEWTMSAVDYSVRFKPNLKDGAFASSGKEIAFFEGHTAAILRAERTMLNFITFLSGVATQTRQFVDKVKPYGTRILDTRKTLPLLRYLEKYAVFTGGGSNHRMGLYDQVLIKDNHIQIQRSLSAGRGNRLALKSLVQSARKKNLKGTVIEIEVETIEEFADALSGGPDIIMLDNMSCEEVKACVGIKKSSKIKPVLEVSGGVSLDTVEAYARTGVDTISIGSLTASVKAVDLSLDLA